MNPEVSLSTFLENERMEIFKGITQSQLSITESWLKQNGLGTDIDSTEVDSATTALGLFNLMLDQNRSVDELHDRYLMVKWIEDLRITEDPLNEAINYWNNIENVPYYEANPGAYRLYRYLHLSGIDIPRVTSRPSRAHSATIEWYRRNSPWVVQKDLVHMTEKDEVDPKFKAEKIKSLHLGAFFEDAFEEAEVFAKNGVLVTIVPQRWNIEKHSNHPNLLTVQDRHNDFKVLDLDSEEFLHLPKVLQAYYVLADEILARNK